MINLLMISLLAGGPVLERALLLDPPKYDERISHAACGERVVIVRVLNLAGFSPSLTEVTINGVKVAVPDSPPETGLLSQFRTIDGAEIECEQKTDVPHITFKGSAKQDDDWLKSSEACTARGGVWLNNRWERYEAVDGELRRASTLTPVCARGKPSPAESAENR